MKINFYTIFQIWGEHSWLLKVCMQMGTDDAWGFPNQEENCPDLLVFVVATCVPVGSSRTQKNQGDFIPLLPEEVHTRHSSRHVLWSCLSRKDPEIGCTEGWGAGSHRCFTLLFALERSDFYFIFLPGASDLLVAYYYMNICCWECSLDQNLGDNSFLLCKDGELTCIVIASRQTLLSLSIASCLWV